MAAVAQLGRLFGYLRHILHYVPQNKTCQNVLQVLTHLLNNFYMFLLSISKRNNEICTTTCMQLSQTTLLVDCFARADLSRECCNLIGWKFGLHNLTAGALFSTNVNNDPGHSSNKNKQIHDLFHLIIQIKLAEPHFPIKYPNLQIARGRGYNSYNFLHCPQTYSPGYFQYENHRKFASI